MKSTTALRKTIHKSTTEIREHVDALRTEITALREEREWLETGPLPKSEVIDQVNLYIDGEADRYDIHSKISGATFSGRNLRDELSGLFAAGGHITNGHATNGIATGFIDSNIGPMLAHFFGDQIKATLTTDIEGLSYQAGPPAAERTDLIANLNTKIHDLEIEEETLIETAGESGIEILRRPDCDPAIVLEFEIIEEEVLDPPAHGATG